MLAVLRLVKLASQKSPATLTPDRPCRPQPGIVGVREELGDQHIRLTAGDSVAEELGDQCIRLTSYT